ncbi:MAG: response regulator [bacterium]
MSNDIKEGFKILIVDDVPQNIQVLANILKKAGYQLGFAKDGKTALAHTESTQFDLILLDIMMPEMDGHEVCARLKKAKKSKDIPVIFISAKDEIKDKTRGFELGAVDYITKPFDAQEVLARVKTHLTLRHYAVKLEQMVEERTRQLIHAERLATLGTFSAAIIHEINNPLSYVIGNAKLLELFWQSAKPILEGHVDEDKTGEIEEDIKDVDEWLKFLQDGSHRISRLVKTLKTYARQGGHTQKEKSFLMDIVNDAVYLVSHKLKLCGVTVDVAVPADLMITCDPQKISQVFVNLMNNACDATADRKGNISIHAAALKNWIDIRIRDNGSGISKEIAERIFDPFFTTKEKDKGTGLGLFIIKNIIEEHEGSIELSHFDGKGTEFKILLPIS